MEYLSPVDSVYSEENIITDLQSGNVVLEEVIVDNEPINLLENYCIEQQGIPKSAVTPSLVNQRPNPVTSDPFITKHQLAFASDGFPTVLDISNQGNADTIIKAETVLTDFQVDDLDHSSSDAVEELFTVKSEDWGDHSQPQVSSSSENVQLVNEDGFLVIRPNCEIINQNNGDTGCAVVVKNQAIFTDQSFCIDYPLNEIVVCSSSNTTTSARQVTASEVLEDERFTECSIDGIGIPNESTPSMENNAETSMIIEEICDRDESSLAASPVNSTHNIRKFLDDNSIGTNEEHKIAYPRLPPHDPITPDTIVSLLQKKIDKPFRKEFIVTSDGKVKVVEIVDIPDKNTENSEHAREKSVSDVVSVQTTGVSDQSNLTGDDPEPAYIDLQLGTLTDENEITVTSEMITDDMPANTNVSGNSIEFSCKNCKQHFELMSALVDHQNSCGKRTLCRKLKRVNESNTTTVGYTYAESETYLDVCSDHKIVEKYKIVPTSPVRRSARHPKRNQRFAECNTKGEDKLEKSTRIKEVTPLKNTEMSSLRTPRIRKLPKRYRSDSDSDSPSNRPNKTIKAVSPPIKKRSIKITNLHKDKGPLTICSQSKVFTDGIIGTLSLKQNEQMAVMNDDDISHTDEDFKYSPSKLPTSLINEKICEEIDEPQLESLSAEISSVKLNYEDIITEYDTENLLSTSTDKVPKIGKIMTCKKEKIVNSARKRISGQVKNKISKKCTPETEDSIDYELKQNTSTKNNSFNNGELPPSAGNEDLVAQVKTEITEVNPKKRGRKPKSKLLIKPEYDSSGKPICDICGKVLGNLYTLKEHRKIHLDVKEFACEVCGRCFRQRGQMRTHFHSVHEGMKAFMCSRCGKNLGSKKALEYHMNSHANSDYMVKYKRYVKYAKRIVIGNPHAGETSENKIGYFMCMICKKQYKYIELWLWHLKKHVETDFAISEDQLSTISGILEECDSVIQTLDVQICHLCDKEFVDSTALASHERELHRNDPDKPHQCSQCGVCYPTAKRLTIHINTSHLKQHSCDICGAVFTMKTHVKAHIAALHQAAEQETAHGCLMCGLRIDIIEFDEHLRTKHAKVKRCLVPEKDKMCHVCQKMFRTTHNLKVHIRTHTKEAPHACHICGKRFSDPANLIHHGRRVHPECPQEIFKSSTSVYVIEGDIDEL